MQKNLNYLKKLHYINTFFHPNMVQKRRKIALLPYKIAHSHVNRPK